MAEYIVEYPSWVGEFIDVRSCANMHERIVRCRDCKHYFNDPDDIYYAYQIPVCMYFADGDGFNAAYVKPDGFCAWGEPKEGD